MLPFISINQKRLPLSLLILLLLLTVISGCQGGEAKQEHKDLQLIQSKTKSHSSKKVMLILVDSLMSESIDLGMKQGRLPALQYLIERGQYEKKMVTSFPSMTVVVNSSLFTGGYPDKHRVPGLTWFSASDQRVINYGTGPEDVLKNGVNQALIDGLVRLNQSHLSKHVTTLFEALADRGISTGSINGMIYRGKTEHALFIPAWLSGFTSLPKKIKVVGPDFFTLGSLSNPLQPVKNMPDGLTARLGFTNENSIEAAKYLVQQHRLPQFLFVYMPDTDQQLHKMGPYDVKDFQKVDDKLQQLLNSFGSWKKALEEVNFIIMGDHGQSQVLPANKNAIVSLPGLLQGYQLVPTGEPVTKDSQVLIAVNDRMAYIYSLQPSPSVANLASALQKDPRIDLLAWKEGSLIHVRQGGTGKELTFQKGDRLTDPYQQRWVVKGNLEVLDLNINKAKRTLSYGQYPDALMRLYGALNSQSGSYLVATAAPGYELVGDSSPSHPGGGAHGSLHQVDSLVPLIITGTDAKPKYWRVVDLKDYVLKLSFFFSSNIK